MGRRQSDDKARSVPLTERQAYWLKHHRACEASGLTAKAYAKEQRISIHALYQARKDLRRRETLASPRKKPSLTFARVQPAPAAVWEQRWQIRFPNGAVIELEAPRNPEDQTHLLQSVAVLT